MMKRHVRACIVVCLCLLLRTNLAVAQPQLASTDPPVPAASDCSVPDPKVHFVGRSSTLCIPVTDKNWTTLAMPEGVEVYSPEPDDTAFEFAWHRNTRQLHVTAKPGTPVGTVDTAKIIGPGYSATIEVRAAAKTRTEIEVEHITEEEVRRRVEVEAKRQEAVMQYEEEHAKRQAIEEQLNVCQSTTILATRDLENALVMARRNSRKTAKELAQSKAALAAKDKELAAKGAELASKDAALIATTEKLATTEKAKARAERERDRAIRSAEEAEREMLIDAVKRHQAEYPHVLAPSVADWVNVKHGAQRLRFGQAFTALDYIVFPLVIENPAGRPLQLTGVSIVDAAGNKKPASILDPTGHENAAKKIITTVGEGEQVQLLLGVKRGANHGPVSIELTEYMSMRPPIAAQFPDYVMVPVTQEQKKRERWGQQVILGPTVSFGGCWLADGIDGTSTVDATTCTIAGLRVTKGFFESVALQAEVTGGATGDAKFDAFTRSAKFGRATISGVVRLGAYSIPYVQLGIGAQGTNYDVSDGGPEGSFEFASFWTFGAGYDMRFGDLLIGAQVVGEVGMQDDKLFRNALSIGVHLGYGWNTGGRDK